MKLKKIKIPFLFVSFILLSNKVYAGYPSFWMIGRNGGIQGNLSNWIGYSIVVIIILSTVTTIVIWKSYLSEWILKKSIRNDAIWDIENLKSHTRESIRRLNDSIQNKDLSKVSDLLTTELFDELNSGVLELTKKGEKNILRCNDIRVLEIIGCEDYKNNSFDKYVAYIQGYMLDYTISETTGEIIKNKKRQVWKFSHTYHFIRVKNQWKLEKINNSASTLDVLKTKNLFEK